MRFWKALAIALLALFFLAPAASARGREGGAVVVRPYSYGFYYGPAFNPWFYGPGWWYDPWDGPPWGPAYVPGSNTGQVKIVTKYQGDSIYVDGGYAGRTGKLKKFRSRAGAHTIRIRDRRGHTIYQERVQVLAGRTLKIHPDYSG